MPESPSTGKSKKATAKTALRIETIELFEDIMIQLIHSLKILAANLCKMRAGFPREYIGKLLFMEDGQEYKVFRHLKVKPGDETKNSVAIFKVKFKFKKFSPKVNRYLSIFPTPFLLAQREFMEKIWAINEDNNYFQGIYQWKSKAAADKYPSSFIFKIMTKRAASGTVNYEIIPNTDLSEYIKRLRVE